MNKTTLFQKTKILLSFYFRLFALYILFFICVALLQQLFPDIDLEKYSQDGIQEILKGNRIKAFFTLVVFAPIVEEFMFRTLIKPERHDILLFLSAWSFFLLSMIFSSEIAWYYQFILTSFIIIGLFFIYKHTISINLITKSHFFLKKHQNIVLQVSSLLFGFAHVFNYVDSIQLNNTLFLLIVPRIMIGHMNGILKIKNNHIIWPILLHAINNGVVFLVAMHTY